ncbi:hypothetical protein JCM10908_000990 [Rhodotorula pacifica]|uniref:putative GTPase NOG2 n=1 Tax=Rhodotorula pacifica TaxID=1495444 RepID=UPI003178343F
MVRDTSNPTTKARSSKHAAATGLKTGNVRTKGENFYRDAKSARRVNLLSGKSSKAIRDSDGKILKAAEFQSTEATPGRIQPDRRWFGNTRTITQTALDHFRETLKDKIADPYAVVLKQNKLPMSLLSDAVRGGGKQDLVSAEPFSDTFGTKAQRKRPKLDIGSIEELASKVATHQAKVAADAVQAEKDQRLSEIRDVEGSIAPELLAAEEEKQLSNVPQDYILAAGTSKRIWGELYKVIDSSDVILHVLDARDPIGTRCDSVEAYLAKEKRGKKVIYVLNKVDLVPGWVAARWVKILSKTHPTIAFHASINNSFGKGSLIQLLRQFSTLFSDKKQISVGFIGYPNVGKSSIINTLKKKAVCKTAPIPGETKVWQYITLMRRIYLIDCPGIVPPSARDSESQKVLKGIVRVEHLSDPAQHIQFLLDRVRKEYLVRTYGIQDWSSSEDFLTQLARKAGKLHRGGEADFRTVATMVLNDWIRGKIPFYVAPPEPTDAAGKPLPRPLKFASSSATAATASTSSASNGASSANAGAEASVFDKLDANGNTTRRVPGVQQPLHQIVHTTKFLPDDVRRIEEEQEDVEEEDEDEDEADEEVGDETFEDDGEEWGGIEESGEEEAEDDDAAPLEWDELFAQAAGDAESAEEELSDGGSEPEFTVEVEEEFDVDLDDEEDDSEDVDEEEEDSEFGTGDEDDVEILVNGKEATSGSAAAATAAANKASKQKAPAGAKRTRAIDVVSSDEEESGRPVKEKRMTTNKKKATNFFTHANVKNKSRRGGPVKDQQARKAAVAGTGIAAPKGHAGTSKKRSGGGGGLGGKRR